MDKVLFEKQFGSIVKESVKVEGLKLIQSSELDVGVGLDFLAAKLEAAIPGDIDKPVIALILAGIKAALLKL